MSFGVITPWLFVILLITSPKLWGSLSSCALKIDQSSFSSSTFFFLSFGSDGFFGISFALSLILLSMSRLSLTFLSLTFLSSTLLSSTFLSTTFVSLFYLKIWSREACFVQMKTSFKVEVTMLWLIVKGIFNKMMGQNGQVNG